MSCPSKHEKVDVISTKESDVESHIKGLPFELKNILNERIRQYVEWTEKAEIDMRKEIEIGESQAFSRVLNNKIKNSLAGQFINEFSPGKISQNEQDYKYFISKYTLEKNEFPSCYARENNYVDNLMDIIEKLVKTEKKGRITLRHFLNSLNHLRLHSSKIGIFDKPLHSLSELQVLNLAGNCITHLPLGWLPQKLKFLEMSGNIISEFRHTENGPPLMYLGLSKNILDDSSDMSGLLLMKCLVYLDLSDNDFCDIDNLLAGLSQLQSLTSLSLKGNPCSVTIGYAWKVMKGLPYLTYLDGRSLKELDEGKLKEENQKYLSYGKLYIHVYRIMGLARTGKRGRGYYDIELQLPLLDEDLKERLASQLEEELEDQSEPVFDYYGQTSESSQSTPEEIKKNEETIQTSPDRRFSLKRKSVMSSVSAAEKKHRMSGTWRISFANFLQNDMENNLEGISKLRSEKLYWNAIMKPKNPIIEVMVPPENIIDLRDTLRSIITLRIYYIEDKRTVKSSSLVAKIRIPAEVPLWYEDYKGYNWEATNYCTARPFPGIGEFRFAVGGRGMTRNADVKSAVFPPPPNPTCHIGISLQRFIK